jgi:hypothetical protein
MSSPSTHRWQMLAGMQLDLFTPLQDGPLTAGELASARRKSKRMRHQTKGARDRIGRIRRTNPHLLAHWVLCHRRG